MNPFKVKDSDPLSSMSQMFHLIFAVFHILKWKMFAFYLIY